MLKSLLIFVLSSKFDDVITSNVSERDRQSDGSERGRAVDMKSKISRQRKRERERKRFEISNAPTKLKP